MPAVLEPRPAQLPVDARRKLTRQDCRALAEEGLLEVDRFELVDEELIRKIPKSRLHSLIAVLDATNEPEPDAIALKRSSADFPQDNPGPADILLVAGVSVTTRKYDLGTKGGSVRKCRHYRVLGARFARVARRSTSPPRRRPLQLHRRLCHRRSGDSASRQISFNSASRPSELTAPVFLCGEPPKMLS